MASTAQTGESGLVGLDAGALLRAHASMVEARLLEERLIKMSKGGEGFFWIGGPGEEAFSVPLGMQVKKGRGVEHDFLHLHYRSSGVFLGLGGQSINVIRQMRSTATDPYSKGRQFVNHYSIPEWNVVPMTPVIEQQYSLAIGTGIAQARVKTDAITIVNGGDAGSAEGDFHSCLVWANRPALPLPILIIVVNNGYGISTHWREQHGERQISDWGRVFNMPSKTVDGNDFFASWQAIAEAMAYVRKERKPYLLEAVTSRLHGHSSSSGANRVDEPDSLARFEAELAKRGVLSPEAAKKLWAEKLERMTADYLQVRQEPYPKPESIWDDVFSGPLPASYPRKGGS